MNNTVKKIVASITALTCALWMVGSSGVAQALTVEELLALIAGADTLEDLQADIAAAQAAEEEEEEGVVTIEGVPADFTFETNLKQTDTGDDVKYLQIVLNSDSDTQLAESGVGSPGEETSYFGPLTKAAVIKFQELYTEDVLASWGLTEGTGYVGSTTRAKLNELLAAAEEEEEEEEEEVPEVGLGVALAAGTPVAASAPTSTSVLFTEINFTAAEEGDVKVSAITVTRTGLGGDTDVTGVTLYDGSDKLGSTRNTFNSDHQMKFNIPDGWTIPAGETKTLAIRAELDKAGTYNALGIAAADDIISDASEVTGTFPITGNEMTGVSVAIGEVTVDAEGITSQIKKIGTDDVTLAAFSLDVDSTEDVKFEKIVLKNKGTTRDTDIANVYLMQAADVLAGPVSMVRDYVTLVLDEPYLIEKNDKVIFKVVGDIADGAGNTVEFILKNDIDLVCTGQTYGYNAAVVRTEFDETTDPLTSLTNITGAQLNFNLESTVRETPDEVRNYVFATLELTAAAEDTRITNTIIWIMEVDSTGVATGSNAEIEEVELVDTADGSSFSGALTSTSTGEIWTFDDEIYLTEGVKRSLEIRGDIPSGVDDGDQYYVYINCSTTDIEAEGVESGDTITDFSVTELTGRKVTVKTGALLVTATPMMVGDATIDAKDVVLFEGKLIAGPASALTIDRMTFEGSSSSVATGTANATYFDIDNISRVVLYADGEEEQVLTYSDLSAGVADFSSLSLVVPAGSANYVLFEVKADIKHTLAPNTTLRIRVNTVSTRDEDGDTVFPRKADTTLIADGNEVNTDRVVSLHGVGILKVAVNKTDADVNKDRYTLGGTATDWVGKIKVRAENEPILIKDLILTNATTTSDDSDTAIYLYEDDKETLIGATDLGANVAYFDDVNYEVALGTEYLYIKAGLRKIGTDASDTADSGDAFQFKISADTATPDIIAEGVQSGGALTTATTTYGVGVTIPDGVIVYYDSTSGSYSATSTTSTTATTTEFVVTGTKISAVDLVTSASGKSVASSLSDGSNNVAILKVVTDVTTNTDNEGTLLKTVLTTIKLDVSKTGSTTVNSITIERIGGSVAAQTMTTSTLGVSDTSGTSTVTSTLGIDAKIDSGGTAYYLVKADLTLFTTIRDFIQVDLKTLNTTPNIIWEDGDATHPDSGDPNAFSALRLDVTSVDGIKILEPVI